MLLLVLCAAFDTTHLSDRRWRYGAESSKTSQPIKDTDTFTCTNTTHCEFYYTKKYKQPELNPAGYSEMSFFT